MRKLVQNEIETVTGGYGLVTGVVRGVVQRAKDADRKQSEAAARLRPSSDA